MPISKGKLFITVDGKYPETLDNLVLFSGSLLKAHSRFITVLNAVKGMVPTFKVLLIFRK